MEISLKIASLLLLTVITACAVNPVTGESELSLISTEQELAIGEQQYGPSQQSQGGQYVVDAELQAYVANIGQALAKVSDRPELPYEFVVLNNSVPNAWALPGGKIAINRGLLLELEDEAELAAVLGHEIVHAAARHGASQMSRGTLVELTAQLATIAASTQGYGQAGSMASQMGGAIFMASYGREDELEADKYGIRYMSRAGYDPQGAVSLQETFVRLSKNRQQDIISGLFASHPPSQDRVDANRKRAKDLPSGERYRARYQQHIAPLKKDAPAYTAQEEALAALKQKKPKRALELLDKAIAIQPREAQFWEMRGHAWSMLDNPDNADKAYSTAIDRNPGVFSAKLYRGLLRYERGNYQAARPDLEQSYALLPTAVSAFYLGELFLEEGNTTQAIPFYQQAASSGSKDLAGKAQNRLAVLELAQRPHKYIVSQPLIGRDGYLRVAVKNNTNIAVTGVKVQVQEMSNPYTVSRSLTLPDRLNLAPGQQVQLKTRIGPFKSKNDVQAYRAQVISAAPASQVQAAR